MDARLKAKIENAEKALIEEGFERLDQTLQSEQGPADYTSFFELMIDRKLDGKPMPDAQELWNDMKAQVNFLRRELSFASDEYRKLENQCRILKNDLTERIKEK